MRARASESEGEGEGEGEGEIGSRIESVEGRMELNCDGSIYVGEGGRERESGKDGTGRVNGSATCWVTFASA